MSKREAKVLSIPKQTLKRLPRYLNYLQQCKRDNLDSISATQISKVLSIQHTQVRKDLALTGVQGTPKIGHSVDTLIDAITIFLGWNDNTTAFLVGMGNLGKAISGYEGFKSVGIKTLAVFDRDPKIVGKKINNIEILPVSKFSNLARRMHVKIGIITVSHQHAQAVAEMMIEAGIEAIWNFCPVELKVPDNIIVENMDIYSSLGVLTRKLKEKNR